MLDIYENPEKEKKLTQGVFLLIFATRKFFLKRNERENSSNQTNIEMLFLVEMIIWTFPSVKTSVVTIKKRFFPFNIFNQLRIYFFFNLKAIL